MSRNSVPALSTLRSVYSPSSVRSGRRPLLAITCVTLLSVTALTGCGKSGGDETSKDAVASLGTAPQKSASSSGSGDDSGGPTMSIEDATTLYNSCMTDAGFGEVIAMLNADSSGAIDDANTSPLAFPADFDQEAFMEADKECSAPLNDVIESMNSMSPEQEVAMEDAMAVFNKCMEEKGFKMGAVAGGPGETPATMNATEAAALDAAVQADPEGFDAATQTCSQLLAENDTLNDLLSLDETSG